ncbi:MAG: TorF family putative porin [Rhodoferax sp.]
MTLKTASALTLAVLATLTGWGTAFAQTEAAPSAPAPAAAAPTPDYTLAYNIGVVTDYRYRGITQSRFDPALQGGVDFTHKSGFYLGAWASGIKWIKDAGASDGSLELDLYGGYKGSIAKDLSYDVGYLRYQYVGNKLGDVAGFDNANTDEIYGAMTWGIFTAKYSDSISNLFGTPDSKNSGYLDLSANFDLGSGWSVVPHVGHQWVHHNSGLSYTDYALTLGKDFGNGLSASLAVVGTDASKTLYVAPDGRFTGRTGVVLGAKYTF